jgi:hypothetical protein
MSPCWDRSVDVEDRARSERGGQRVMAGHAVSLRGNNSSQHKILPIRQPHINVDWRPAHHAWVISAMQRPAHGSAVAGAGDSELILTTIGFSSCGDK